MLQHCSSLFRNYHINFPTGSPLFYQYRSMEFSKSLRWQKPHSYINKGVWNYNSRWINYCRRVTHNNVSNDRLDSIDDKGKTISYGNARPIILKGKVFPLHCQVYYVHEIMIDLNASCSSLLGCLYFLDPGSYENSDSLCLVCPAQKYRIVINCLYLSRMWCCSKP